ncbi:MAG: DUF4339 domain-containing protein [Bdellovibrionales bacterium]|nr:DUF4339 domain-containing protein [Bdellovibrionales bacterium]
MSNQKFVVSHMEQQMGPFDEQELKSLWAKGEILPIDYIFDEVKEDWVTLAEHFVWAKAPEVSPPPPVRTDAGVARKSAAALTNPAVAPKAETVKLTPASAQATAAMPAAPGAVAMPAATKAQTPAPTPAPVAAAAPAMMPVQMHTAQLAVQEVTQPQITLRSEPSKGGETITVETKALQRAAAAPTAAQLTMVDGVGQIELSSLHPGLVQLVPKEGALQKSEPMKLEVKPAEPVSVEWKIAKENVVGTDLEISLRAIDEFGDVCLHYTDQFVIQVRGPTPRDITVTTEDGQAIVKMNHTKAEEWTFTLHYGGKKKLRLPEVVAMEWQPGQAARLVLDGPHEYIAGRPVKVAVKAVDAYGNVAKHFQGTVALDVKAS